MDFGTIYRLSGSIPRDSSYFELYHDDSREQTNNIEEVNRFAICYKDLAFGWHFIKSYSDIEECMPASVVEEHSLIRAYNFERHGGRDIPMAQAVAIETALPQNIKNTITSMFFCEGITIQKIAEVTNFDEDTIRLYEELFFNILDRKSQSLFMAGLVYPETRAEEFSQRYLDFVDSNTLLRRASYNSGIESTMALAGFKETFLEFGNAADNTTKLESAMMSNAFFLASCGFLNSRNSPGITNAKGIMAAAKLGGNDDASFQETGVGMAPMGSIIVKEIMSSQQDEISERIERTRVLQEVEVQRIRDLDHS